jgi:hypothetical protein
VNVHDLTLAAGKRIGTRTPRRDDGQ